jgi:uncharacterized protein YukE
VTDYHQLPITAISQSVSTDKIDEMQHQADAWHGLAFLFDSQLARLTTVTNDLAATWGGPAGAAFVAQVGRVQATLTQGRDTAKSNAASWARVINEATSAREAIYRLEGKYKAEVAKNQADFDHSWLNNPITDALGLTSPPTAADEAAIREKYDKQARTLLDHASSVYAEVFSSLQEIPTYTGPLGTNARQWGDSNGSGSATDPGSGVAHLLGGVALTAGTGIGAAWTEVAPSGPSLAGTAAPSLPAPSIPGGYPSPAAPGPGGLPPGGPSGGLFPPVPVKTGPAPRVPTGRTPLLAEPVEPGRTVIGSRPQAPGPRARGGLADESVIGSRRGGPGPAEGGGRPAVRPSDGRAVIGRETPATSRSTAKGRAGGVDEDGVIRANRRAEPAEGRSGAAGQRAHQRRDDHDPQAEPDDGTDLWEVADGVPAVVEPPAAYDPKREHSGPHVGRSDRRRR